MQPNPDCSGKGGPCDPGKLGRATQKLVFTFVSHVFGGDDVTQTHPPARLCFKTFKDPDSET